jgi:hypothetical protein
MRDSQRAYIVLQALKTTLVVLFVKYALCMDGTVPLSIFLQDLRNGVIVP